MIKIRHNFLYKEKIGEKAPPIKSFVKVRRQKVKATNISEGQMEDTVLLVILQKKFILDHIKNQTHEGSIILEVMKIIIMFSTGYIHLL